MDQYRSRLKLSENFERHWSIPISGEIHIDQSLVHTFSWGNSYGPMVLKVLPKFPLTLVLVHGWLFPVNSPRAPNSPEMTVSKSLESPVRITAPKNRVRKISPKFSCIKFFQIRDVPTQIPGHPGHSVCKTTEKGHLHKVFVRDVPTSGSRMSQEYPVRKLYV